MPDPDASCCRARAEQRLSLWLVQVRLFDVPFSHNGEHVRCGVPVNTPTRAVR